LTLIYVLICIEKKQLSSLAMLILNVNKIEAYAQCSFGKHARRRSLSRGGQGSVCKGEPMGGRSAWEAAARDDVEDQTLEKQG
jgi:hypothetical protein